MLSQDSPDIIRHIRYLLFYSNIISILLVVSSRISATIISEIVMLVVIAVMAILLDF